MNGRFTMIFHISAVDGDALKSTYNTSSFYFLNWNIYIIIYLIFFLLYSSYCRSPLDYDRPFDSSELEISNLNYGYTNFNNFFNAYFTVFHIVRVIAWGRITFMVNYQKKNRKIYRRQII